jgi:hypothetical protein
MEALAPNLRFVKNPAQWWTHLQGGIRQVEETDYPMIASRFAPAETPSRVAEELAARSLFALEAHLEEFIAHNWSKISWGTALDLYREGGQTGRQFPAGTWCLDFLAVDPKMNALVVIELKRGQTSDATVGQVLRYINWVREHVAVQGQDVPGIIITGCPTLSAFFAEGWEARMQPERTKTFQTRLTSLWRSPRFPNWNQIGRCTAFLLLSHSTHDKI